MNKDTVNKKDIFDKIMPVIESVSVKLNLELVEVDFVKESGRWFLRIFIYSHDHGITHEDCESMSRGLSDLLDELIPVNYYLEISSPGSERKLKSSKEYSIFKGKKVKIKLKQPLKEGEDRIIFGNIIEYKQEGILIVELVESKQIVEIQEDNINTAQLCFK